VHYVSPCLFFSPVVFRLCRKEEAAAAHVACLRQPENPVLQNSVSFCHFLYGSVEIIPDQPFQPSC
ncbi:MAG: hypothetical protein ACLSGZ_01290, partial [Gallintestinimicrobium sp.]